MKSSDAAPSALWVCVLKWKHVLRWCVWQQLKSLCVCADSAKRGSPCSSGDVCCSRSITSGLWFRLVFLQGIVVLILEFLLFLRCFVSNPVMSETRTENVERKLDNSNLELFKKLIILKSRLHSDRHFLKKLIDCSPISTNDSVSMKLLWHHHCQHFIWHTFFTQFKSFPFLIFLIFLKWHFQSIFKFQYHYYKSCMCECQGTRWRSVPTVGNTLNSTDFFIADTEFVKSSEKSFLLVLPAGLNRWLSCFSFSMEQLT